VAKRRQAPPKRTRPGKIIGGAAALAVTTLGLAAFLVLRSSSPTAPVPWATFGSRDVHALTFVDGDPQHLLFGHHGGLEETRDGGRTWSQLPVRDDAMSMSAASDASIVIAGHEVFLASGRGNWRDASQGRTV
jgi:photosystem II stability/assembly factor-like uncharacterized protein